MKKVTYLLLLMFATVLLTTSCEEDELITPEETSTSIITLDEFAGYWNFVQCEYNNVVYTTCEDVENDPNVNLSMGTFVVNLNIELVPEIYDVDFNSHVDWINKCAGATNNNLECTLNEKQNVFYLGNDMLFEILEYDKTTKTLRTKLIEPLGLDYSLDNAIYTWEK